MEWTDEQKKAIETRGCNLLISAAAGSGKTAVLVQRIIEKLIDEENPIDIDRLLVVTFTNAAASEMREKIGNALSKELEKNPSSKNLQKQLALLNKASIKTIHAFCLDVIRSNFEKIDIDPDFRIGDETECTILKQEAVEELFDMMYEDENVSDDFLKLVDCYGGKRDDSNLEEIVLNLYEFSRSLPNPSSWLKNSSEDFNQGEDFSFGESKWAKVIIKCIRIELEGLKEQMEDAIEIINDYEELSPYYETYSEDMAMIDELINASLKDWDELRDSFANCELRFSKLKNAKKGADEEAKKRVKKVRDDFKGIVKNYNETIFNLKNDEIIKELKSMYPLMKCLSNLVDEFEKIYKGKKRDRGILDFSDIEHYCIDILTVEDEEGNRHRTDAAEKLSEKFEEILVDEYQDSNLVQEIILKSVSRNEKGEPNIFMVGDVKQSIYRFRQAMPELFLQKYNTYTITPSKAMKINLFKNFRSRKEIIDGVNYIFKAIMSSEVGELEYDEKEELNLGANYAETGDNYNIELHVIENKVNIEDGQIEKSNFDLEDIEDIDSIQLEAKFVGKRIRELIQSGFKVYDKEKDEVRPVKYSDIVILMRSTRDAAPIFVEELTSLNIPVYADTGTGYFNTVEVSTVMSLLQIIDNPRQDIPLLSVLRSPIFGFSTEDLINIRLEDKEGLYFDALNKKAEKKDDELSERASAFIDKLKCWKEKSINMPISEFIWYLYTETGYFAYSAALPGGTQRQANLRILFERAKTYEETSLKGLFNFINFINRLKISSGDMGSAKILGENENVVRIMSIHKSKGLEFPVCFISGMGRKINFMDLNKPILFHHDLGFGPEYIDVEKRISYPTIFKEAIKCKVKLETLSEEMRILYVAFTRAKEKLILTGYVRNMESALNGWDIRSKGKGSKISKFNVLTSKTYFDLICPEIIRHPDGKPFRDMEGFDFNPLCSDFNSKWDVNLYSKMDILQTEQENIEEEKNRVDDILNTDLSKSYSNFDEEINKRLNFEYAYKKASEIPQVLSITEVKNILLEDEYEKPLYSNVKMKKPAFLDQKKTISPAEKGIATHLVMQKIDMEKVNSPKEIKEQVDYMVKRELLSNEEGKAVDENKIYRFFISPLGTRMIKAEKTVKRETEFNMFIESSEIYKELPPEYKNEKIFLRGIIDCYFEENGEIVLIDYKTDYLKDGEEEEIKKKYGIQLDYYSRALEKITGLRVKEKYLYMFYNGSTIIVD